MFWGNIVPFVDIVNGSGLFLLAKLNWDGNCGKLNQANNRNINLIDISFIQSELISELTVPFSTLLTTTIVSPSKVKIQLVLQKSIRILFNLSVQLVP